MKKEDTRRVIILDANGDMLGWFKYIEEIKRNRRSITLFPLNWPLQGNPREYKIPPGGQVLIESNRDGLLDTQYGMNFWIRNRKMATSIG